MINIKIMCVGKIKEKSLSSLLSEYEKRISKYAKLDVIEVQDEKFEKSLSDNDANIIKEKESNKIIEKIKKLNKPYLIALDLNGENLTSVEFSKQLETIPIKGYSTIVFIIGGSLGISKKLLDMVNKKICFSSLTFPHQLIRVFLLEQIFRAFKIINNENYHH